MQTIKLISLIAGGIILLGSVIANLIVRIFCKPKAEEDLDDWYYELEDQHPGLQRYNKLINLTHSLIALGALLLFVCAVV